MPETFAPVQLANDTGVKLNATYFNRLETNLETFDDRITAVESGIAAPVTLAYASTVTIDATQGALFRITSTGDPTLINLTGGVDGQLIEVQVKASGADRVLTVAGRMTSAQVGGWWIGQFRYIGPDDVWALTREVVVAPAGGVYPAAYPAAY